jgi:flagellum-specific peptidoglycan hydrolase FlgJ
MTLENQMWLKSTAVEAEKAGHVFPQMAACEAGLESNYGRSELARGGNNLFGMKQHKHPVFGTMVLPTKEFLDNQWQTVDAEWVKYDTIEECFADRMDTLFRLRDAYPHYLAALTAADAYTYITEVSQTWSTDPNRASKVIAIYGEYFRAGGGVSNAEDVQDAATAT